MNAPSDLGSDAPANGCNFPFQIANTGLIGILLNDRLDAILVESALCGEQPMLLDLPRYKVPLSDVQLFHFGIAGYSDSLQPVPERRRHTFPTIVRTDAHHATANEGDIHLAIH